MDPRHLSRIKIIQELYGQTFVSQKKVTETTKNILAREESIRNTIKNYAPKFPLEKIAKVDLAILELAVYELTIEKKEPPKVVINEAVQLAHELGNDKSYSFVNAVLGKVFSSSNQA